jgi:hypothetical protein
MFYQRRGSKYGNKTKEYGSRIYHSKKEAAYAHDLAMLQKAGEIIEIVPQFRLSLDVNGYHICNYIVDFMVTTRDGSVELHEVKGFETDIWRMKWKLAEALYGDKYKLIVIK